jgi:hypothetical protein
VRRLRLWRGGEPFVQGAALIGLEMAKADPAQSFGRHDAAEGVASEAEHLAQTGVKQKRFVAQDQKLIEDEAGGRGDIRHKGREPEDAVGDFADLGLHASPPN